MFGTGKITHMNSVIFKNSEVFKNRTYFGTFFLIESQTQWNQLQKGK